MADKPAELCDVCHHPANEDEGELVSVVGTVPNSQTSDPRIQRVHADCRQYVNVAITEPRDQTGLSSPMPMQRHTKIGHRWLHPSVSYFRLRGYPMRKQHRLTDDERETIQSLRKFGPLNISQTARAMRCSRSTVRYWQATKIGVDGPEFVRPVGMFA